MYKKGYAVLLFLSCNLLLSGCISQVWTGANLVYDRHHVYKKINDFQLAANANRALYRDLVFKQPDISLELAVFNKDILLVGQVPTGLLREEVYQRIKAIPGYRRIFNQVEVSREATDPLKDSWITTEIRGHIFSDASIDPHAFKVITSNQIVYLMGDVIPQQAKHVIYFARTCVGVRRVVKLFKYYNLSNQPA
jgi:osmotically-inducible protein OsmY